MVTISWDDILKSGEDSDRFDQTKGVELVGYVVKVKPGDPETCNCNASDDILMDTHIELAKDESDTDRSQRMVVEVTPRVRHNNGWDLLELNDPSLLHHWIRVKGWLTYDFMHRGNALNTAKTSTSIYRATCWEVHPITELVVDPPNHR